MDGASNISFNIQRCANLLVRTRRQDGKAPLPIILLANVQSLDDKLDELRARTTFQWETRDCHIICITETWLDEQISPRVSLYIAWTGQGKSLEK